MAADAPARWGDPVKLSETVTLDPIVDARLRWKRWMQPKGQRSDPAPRRDGVEGGVLASGRLAEATGTLALGKHYSGFSYATPSDQYRLRWPRLAIRRAWGSTGCKSSMPRALTVTLGRQRVNLDDQRFIGAAAWRQHEQTFDAARAEMRSAAGA
jgi:hypothetical protein